MREEANWVEFSPRMLLELGGWATRVWCGASGPGRGGGDLELVIGVGVLSGIYWTAGNTFENSHFVLT